MRSYCQEATGAVHTLRDVEALGHQFWCGAWQRPVRVEEDHGVPLRAFDKTFAKKGVSPFGLKSDKGIFNYSCGAHSAAVAQCSNSSRSLYAADGASSIGARKTEYRPNMSEQLQGNLRLIEPRAGHGRAS